MRWSGRCCRMEEEREGKKMSVELVVLQVWWRRDGRGEVTAVGVVGGGNGGWVE